MIAEAEKGKGAKIKIDYRRLQPYRRLKVNDKNFVSKREEGLKERNFWSKQSSMDS